MTKTILITGCAGFLGSHLARFLLEKEDCKIIGIDDLSTGRKKNIAELLKNKNFRFIKGDITKMRFPKVKIHRIYNLACPASPPHYQKDALKTIKINTVGVINILELARKNKARVFQSSTSEIYGDPTESPQKETYRGNVSTIGPRACYDEGKRMAETLFFEYKRKYGLDIRVVRIFNTYGPFMDINDGRVVSNFINQAIRGKNITIYGKGEQTRSFCFVSDLIEGFYKMMEGDFAGPVNLGNPTEKTILEIAQKIIEMTNSKSKIEYMALPEDDPRQRKPDIGLAKEKLGWEPKISLEEGLKKTIGYFERMRE